MVCSVSGSFAALRMTAKTKATAKAKAKATAKATATATVEDKSKTATVDAVGSDVKGVPDQDEGEGGDDDRCGPGDYVEPVGVGVFAHEVVLVDELQHEDEN